MLVSMRSTKFQISLTRHSMRCMDCMLDVLRGRRLGLHHFPRRSSSWIRRQVPRSSIQFWPTGLFTTSVFGLTSAWARRQTRLHCSQRALWENHLGRWTSSNVNQGPASKMDRHTSTRCAPVTQQYSVTRSYHGRVCGLSFKRRLTDPSKFSQNHASDPSDLSQRLVDDKINVLLLLLSTIFLNCS